MTSFKVVLYNNGSFDVWILLEWDADGIPLTRSSCTVSACSLDNCLEVQYPVPTAPRAHPDPDLGTVELT